MAKLPSIERHTAAKHLILKRYLDAWFPILGSAHKRISYVDGFAGPGEYEGGDQGSPIIAIESASAHFQKGTLSPSVEVDFFFIERDEDSHMHLKSLLDNRTLPNSFRVHPIHGAFDEVIGDVLDSIEKSNSPSLFFVDPFGFAGIPFSSMKRILSYRRCEVFINIMVEHINRFLEHPDEKIPAHFVETFGTDEVLSIPTRAVDRTDAILALYHAQLRRVAGFVGKFDMRTGIEKRIYSLFFASNSSTGFLKMKEAMWSVDKQRGNSFSDRDPEGFYHADLFAFDPLWDDLIRKYGNKPIAMSEIESFVVKDTKYLPTHLRKILLEKEELGFVRVDPIGQYKRKPRTFPTGKVVVTIKHAN